MNQYHIYEKIGKGKYSTVYKGRRKKTISYYAIKSVDKSQKSRVLQEVRTMHALDHKNILHFYAWYETTNHLWLILEYCVGGDLMSLLRQDVRLPETSVHDFGRDLVIALQYLHSHSIVYCDLKPSNILLDENGRLKLGGFGLSRRLADINKTPLQALPPARRGTPCYMAPELFNEGATHSTASDLWALGCVLYEAAMGRPPFLNTSFNQLVHDILNNEPPTIQGASPEFWDLIRRLLDKNPATRLAWKDLVVHPFWQVCLSHVEMPPEPQLEAFIRANNLAPSAPTDMRASMAAAQQLRQSVDITRLSRIALGNLEKEGEGSDYTSVSTSQRPGDVTIENADAELDFEDQKEEGVAGDDEESSAPGGIGDEPVIESGNAGTPPPVGGNAAGGHAGEASSALNRIGMSMHHQQQAGGGGGKPPGVVPGGRGDQAAAATQSMALQRGGRPSNEDVAEGATDQGVLLTHDSDTPGNATGNAAADGSALYQGSAMSVSALIWHATDCVVKPIVANRRIERLPEPKYEDKGLPFKAMSLQEMLSCEQRELETFLTDIYRAIASAAPLKDKVNVLSYFETLCQDTNAANVLINSSLTILFIRMLKTTKAPTLKVRLASVLGLLVRHATFIADELATTGIVEILTESLRDKTDRVRRRVMATLGELLFYVATQQQPEAAVGGGQHMTAEQAAAHAAAVADRWGISNATIVAVTRVLKDPSDDVAQHYAVKTIENICSQGNHWASRFANQDVAAALFTLLATRNENLKATTASTLSRLLRHSPALVTFVVDKYGLRQFVAGLTDPNAKYQTACVNCLCLALILPDLSTRAKASLSEEKGLVPGLMALADHTQPVVKAKAVLAILLLSRTSTKWLQELIRMKLMGLVDRIAKDKDEYLQAALTALRQELCKMVPIICQQVHDELDASAPSAAAASPGAGRVSGNASRRGTATPAGNTASSPARPGTGKATLQQHMQVILHLVNSTSFRPDTITPHLISNLATFLAAATASPNAALTLPGSQIVGVASMVGPNASISLSSSVSEFRMTMQQVIEAVCQQSELVLEHHAAMTETLLPVLCGVVSCPGETSDMRFYCLRMISEVIQLILSDPALYPGGLLMNGNAADNIPEGVTDATAAVDHLIRTSVLPMVPRLLDDEEPMPLYGLKLLGGLLEVNPSLVPAVESLGLAARFAEFLSLEHPNNNVHNIRLVRHIVAGGDTPSRQLIGMEVPEKVVAVLDYAHANAVEPFLEPVLELCHAMANRDAADLAEGRTPAGEAAEGPSLTGLLLEESGTFLELCTSPEPHVGIAASTCLLDMADHLVAAAQQAQQGAQDPSSPGNSAAMMRHVAELPPVMIRNILTCFLTCVHVPGSFQAADVEDLRALSGSVRVVAGVLGDEEGVRQVAAQVQDALSQAM